MDIEGQRLDPSDWISFAESLHKSLDLCIDRLQNAKDYPWKDKPESMKEKVSLKSALEGATPANEVLSKIATDIMPYSVGNTHPRFFGWVHGTGQPVGVGAEIFATTMNCNCGGRNHGAVDVEIAVIEFLLEISGMPADTGFGILTGGTSQATLLSLNSARGKLFGVERVRSHGICDLPAVRVYAADGAHTCIKKALEIMGHGGSALRSVAVDPTTGRMDMVALAAAVEEDRADGVVPMAVVGTAGSVNLGIYDDLQAIAAFCKAQDIWMHVDAAFGFWILLASDPRFSGLIDGIQHADSVGLDFHKWASVPYQAGACLVKHGQQLKETFTMRPAYLAQMSDGRGLSAGDVWFCDYGIDLSRGFSALKVWTCIKTCGVKALGSAINDNCLQAVYMGVLVEQSDCLVLAHPVVSNLCCFRIKCEEDEEATLHADAIDGIVADIQLSGDAVFSTTLVKSHGKCFRAAIVNHRTNHADIQFAIECVERAVKKYLKEWSMVAKTKCHAAAASPASN